MLDMLAIKKGFTVLIDHLKTTQVTYSVNKQFAKSIKSANWLSLIKLYFGESSMLSGWCRYKLKERATIRSPKKLS